MSFFTDRLSSPTRSSRPWLGCVPFTHCCTALVTAKSCQPADSPAATARLATAVESWSPPFAVQFTPFAAVYQVAPLKQP